MFLQMYQLTSRSALRVVATLLLSVFLSAGYGRARSGSNSAGCENWNPYFFETSSYGQVAECVAAGAVLTARDHLRFEVDADLDHAQSCDCSVCCRMRPADFPDREGQATPSRSSV